MGKLVPLQFRPGINREITSFGNEGGWWDCDLIRFRQGYPESIGGWELYIDDTLQGVARDMIAWGNLAGEKLLGIGTHLKYYIVDNNQLYDITPIRETTAAGDVTFSATNGDATITVSDTGHGAIQNDFVTFSGAVSLGGNITADVLNQEYQVATVIDADSYTIEAKDTNGDTVTANASDTGNGGGSVVGEYQITTGRENASTGLGWGADPWGDGGWGDAGTTGVSFLALRTWTHDNFGEDLVFNPRDGAIYYWDATSGVSTRGVNLTSLSGASDVPTIATSVLVSDQDRHVIAFGCDPEDNAGTQDPLLIRFSDQENAADWTTRTTNTAGSIRLSAGSIILQVLQTKREILIFTDTSLHSMQFLGPPFTFGIQDIGQNGQIVGPNAAIAINDVVYWMAEGRFMRYDGTINELRCDVKEYVFSEINESQISKVISGHNSRYSEVWWHYPTSNENDRYVVYNYQQDIWYFGTMDRTAWIETGLFQFPLAVDANGMLVQHESGLDDATTDPASALNSYIESSQVDIEDGDSFFFIRRVIPDITFRHSTANNPSVTMTIKSREFPGANYTQSDNDSVTQSSSSPVELWTNQIFLRVRGRSFALRVEADQVQTAWRLGRPRAEIRPDGKK